MKSRTYVEIPNRLFLIGKRGYGGWTKEIDHEVRLKLTKVLESKGIKCHTEGIEDMFEDEEIEGNERCNSKVIIKVDGEDYTIQNYNVRCLKHESAIKIASFFINKGIDADIEINQGFRGRKIIKSKKINRSSEKQKKKEKNKQTSMFSESMRRYMN